MSTADLASDLRAAAHRLVRRLNASTTDSSLSAVQRGMLAELDLGGELTSADLARLEHVSPQAANVAVGELVKRGLIDRRSDTEDRRRRLLSLTPSGRATIHGVRNDKNSWLDRRLAEDLDESERRTLAEAVEILKRLVAAD